MCALHTPTWVQNLAVGLVELHKVHTGPSETPVFILAAATVPYDCHVFFSTALEQKFLYPESIAHILLATSRILYLAALNWHKLAINLDFSNHGSMRNIKKKVYRI